MPRPRGRLRDGIVVDRKAVRRARRRGSGVEHRHHFGPRIADRGGGEVGVIVVGGDHHAAPRHHAEAADIGPHRLAQHHARTIVVRESQWPFERARRQHHPTRADVPQPLGKAIGGLLTRLGQPFVQRDEIIVPVARGRCAQQDAAAEFADARGGGAGPGGIEIAQIAGERRGENAVLLDQQHTRARLCGGKRCFEARRPRTHHQHIAERRALGEAIGIGLGRCIAEASGAADEVFVEHPTLGRAEESLVVEPRRQRLRRQPKHGTDIEAEARPAVLAR